MPQTIELPDDLAEVLTGEADRLGMTLARYATYLLLSAQLPTKIRTGADLVAYWEAEGLIGPRPDLPDSPIYARQLREQAQRRGE